MSDSKLRTAATGHFLWEPEVAADWPALSSPFVSGPLFFTLRNHRAKQTVLFRLP